MTKMAKDNIGPTVIVVVTQYCDWQHRHKKIYQQINTQTKPTTNNNKATKQTTIQMKGRAVLSRHTYIGAGGVT